MSAARPQRLHTQPLPPRPQFSTPQARSAAGCFRCAGCVCQVFGGWLHVGVKTVACNTSPRTSCGVSNLFQKTKTITKPTTKPSTIVKDVTPLSRWWCRCLCPSVPSVCQSTHQEEDWGHSQPWAQWAQWSQSGMSKNIEPCVGHSGESGVLGRIANESEGGGIWLFWCTTVGLHKTQGSSTTRCPFQVMFVALQSLSVLLQHLPGELPSNHGP